MVRTVKAPSPKLGGNQEAGRGRQTVIGMDSKVIGAACTEAAVIREFTIPFFKRKC